MKDVMACDEFTHAVTGSSLMRKMEENNITDETKEKSQSETEKHHRAPAPHVYPGKKEKRTREHTGRGGGRNRGVQMPKKVKTAKKRPKAHHESSRDTRIGQAEVAS